MQIETEEQALDTILDLVRYSEDNDELAISAAATIYRLMTTGNRDLAMEVLSTYKTIGCIECGDRIDAAIWREELGFCVECSHAYFDQTEEEN